MAMALPYWATGLLGQHRTVNATLLVFLPLWFFFLLNVEARWSRMVERIRIPTKRLWIPMVLLALVVFFTGSGGRASFDLADGTIASFDRQLAERYGAMVDARAHHSTRLSVPAIHPLPRSLRYLDGGVDPEQWINRSMAFYFGADDMRIVVRPQP
ncbi:MAG TPA: hypothetical protein PK760_11160, partial [Flavobacteriales bacterium]|nr:hypothetical protein [Flavobacteriales bacterium]